MAKFIKDGLPSGSEKELNEKIITEDILLPTTFRHQKIKCVRKKLQKCSARQFKQLSIGP